jgi:hypothetical protein
VAALGTDWSAALDKRREVRQKHEMVNERRVGARKACPHCGKAPGLRWWYLLPSNNSRRVLTCVHCSGKYDSSDGSKTASIMGALLGTGPAILLLGKIVKHGHGSAVWVVAGTVAAAGVFMVASVLLAWLTLRLVPKS